LLHSVPRFNNPTGTFDNDRYLLEIITEAPIPALNDFLSGPFLKCVGCEEFGEYACTECTPEPNNGGF
jgi:hypothetical protein